jgi:hypothetical protein
LAAENSDKIAAIGRFESAEREGTAMPSSVPIKLAPALSFREAARCCGRRCSTPKVTPMTYMGRNGKQYVVIVSSGLNAFALP